MVQPWPLTGRDEELRRVAAAIRPGASGIVVAGQAGLGKTRLAREALAAREGQRTTVVWAHGSTAARPFPLGAFAGLLDVPTGDAAEGPFGRLSGPRIDKMLAAADHLASDWLVLNLERSARRTP